MLAIKNDFFYSHFLLPLKFFRKLSYQYTFVKFFTHYNININTIVSRSGKGNECDTKTIFSFIFIFKVVQLDILKKEQ